MYRLSELSPGTKQLIAVLAIMALLLAIAVVLPPANAASPGTGAATADYQVARKDAKLRVGVSNPAADNVTIRVTYSNGSLAAQHSSTSTAFSKEFALSPGNYELQVWQGGESNIVLRKEFRLGTVIDVGFKDVLVKAFHNNLLPVATVVLIGVGFMAISIGRYAGMPIMTVALAIFAINGYMSAWPIYLILLVAAVIFGIALYTMTGGSRS